MTVTALASDPQQWRPLAKVYRGVADAIPMHLALRRLASVERYNRRRRGEAEDLQSTDLDVLKARWLMFTSFVRPLVERQGVSGSNQHVKRTELVRLKPEDDPCAACGGPVYLSAWGKRNVKAVYACPVCTKPVRLVVNNPIPWPRTISLPVDGTPAKLTIVKPVVVEPYVPDIIEWIDPNPVSYRPPDGPLKLPKSKLRLIPVVKPQPQPYSVPEPEPEKKLPKPKPRTINVIVKEAEQRAVKPAETLEEVWQTFKFASEDLGVHLPPIDHVSQSDRKLRATLRKAMEAGMANEYFLLTRFEHGELKELNFNYMTNQFVDVFIEVATQPRAIDWVNRKTANLTDLERHRWAEMLCTAFRFGSFTTVCFYAGKRLLVLAAELDPIVAKMFQPPRQKTIKQRFHSIGKKIFKFN